MERGLPARPRQEHGIEIRYIGNQNDHIPFNLEYNEIDIYNTSYGSSASFLDEFKLAQANLAANLAAGRPCDVRLSGAGDGNIAAADLSWRTSTGRGQTRPTAAAYSGTNWSEQATTAGGYLVHPTRSSGHGRDRARRHDRPPAPDTCARTRLNAGLPANFFVMNPDATNVGRHAEAVGGEPLITRCRPN